MLGGKHITVIIPALNESRSVGRVIDEIPTDVDKIIVVDNGSDDETGFVAKAHGATVIYEHQQGYGSACLSGIKSLEKTDMVAFIDGDYSDYPQDLMQLLKPVASGDYQFAVGCRQNTELNTVDLPLHQRWGNWLACCFIHLLHGFKYADLGPMRCINRDLLAQLNMTDTNYGWTTEMQLKVSQLGIDILQLPVRYRRRIGVSKISGTLKGSLLAGYKILYWTFRLSFKSPKIFGSQ